MKTTLRSLWISVVFLLVTAAGAHAHIIPGDVRGLGSGFAHPLHGLDHILAMVAVGLWAAQLGGRARWLVPAGFVGVMAVGGALAMAGLRVPFTEEGIMLSLLVFGILIAVAARFPLAAWRLSDYSRFFTGTRTARRCQPTRWVTRTARVSCWRLHCCTRPASGWDCWPSKFLGRR